MEVSFEMIQKSRKGAGNERKEREKTKRLFQSLDFAEAGDHIGALLRGVDRTQIERGQVLATN